ncbi:polyketide cyclase [Taibaiella sp. KBW10]|uniref:SRPBCC family protein n=1 Tax=Taibaiella sp. KBW10 TaxID=2153357 RepID=UPI000F5A11A4|nr:SRPBCC family protein [Taibaiella sp. KBW10]RQO32436.1 polyketide cyclase [Taibaiella sp. KBW10]
MRNQTVTVTAQMLIRKPAAEVFQAFIDPAQTINFWFTKSSGPLVEDGMVTWEWEMYQFATEVWVKAIKPNEKITVVWGAGKTTIEFEFKALTEDTTYVEISNYGFTEQGEDLLPVVMDNMGGFTTVLDGLKAYLEHNIRLNLIADKFPPGNK